MTFSNGFFLSKANTFDRVDDKLLATELKLRKVQCEVPGCELPATALIKNKLPTFACTDHNNIYLQGGAAMNLLMRELVNYLKGHMALSAQAAFEDVQNEVISSFTGEGSILDQARQVNDSFDGKPVNVMDRPDVVLATLRVLTPLSSLGTANTEMIFPDIFA